MTDPTSRRAFLTAAGAAGITLILADFAGVDEALAHARHAVSQNPRPAFETLSPADAADLEAMMGRIIPSDDGPGAKEAGAVYFADRALGGVLAPHKDEFIGDLAGLRKKAIEMWPGTTAIAALSAAQLDELIRSVEKERVFGGLRFLTVVGTFGNPSWGGNRDQVGWKRIGHEMKGSFQPPFGYYDAQVEGGR